MSNRRLCFVLTYPQAYKDHGVVAYPYRTFTLQSGNKIFWNAAINKVPGTPVSNGYKVSNAKDKGTPTAYYTARDLKKLLETAEADGYVCPEEDVPLYGVLCSELDELEMAILLVP